MTRILPGDHALRQKLNDEVHARPPESLYSPARVSYLALLSDAAQRDASFLAVCALAARFDGPVPEAGGSHYSADLGPFRLKWERHSEFVRYTVIAPGLSDETALSLVPVDWVASLPGELLVANHVDVLGPSDANPIETATQLFARDSLVGSAIADGAVWCSACWRSTPIA